MESRIEARALRQVGRSEGKGLDPGEGRWNVQWRQRGARADNAESIFVDQAGSFEVLPPMNDPVCRGIIAAYGKTLPLQLGEQKIDRVGMVGGRDSGGVLAQSQLAGAADPADLARNQAG